MTDALQMFELHRPLLFGLAYRMTGVRQDAEDALQETWLRWARVKDADNPRAYLCRITTNICLDQLKSAQAKRETYIGEWLPEPLPDEDGIERAETLTMAFLVALQSLSANERAAFLLKEVFEFDYAEMAQMLDASQAACRQWVARARAAIAERKPRYTADPAQAQRAVMAFMSACASGDIQAAMSAIAPNARAISDGGGRVRGVAQTPIVGAENVARFFMGLVKRLTPAMSFNFEHINAQPALVIYEAGKSIDVICFEIGDGVLQTIFSVLNPDKLTRVAR
jgi:RNA polymerase sigma-70 factor (ECF subfamily)